MDKNKNKIPDWVENVIYWGGVAYVLGNTLKKVMAGEDIFNAIDVTSSGEKNVNDTTK